MYQPGGTVKDVLDAIQSHAYVLPAIQREFVWKPEQIARLFDSMMQGYPFGTFLLWRVNAENSHKYKFYDFVRKYHERDSPHCSELAIFQNTQLTAVLDGQQRITALNIGLRGSMATKLPNKWRSNPDAFPTTYLYLNLLGTPEEDEEGERYRFAFLTKERASKTADDECWFRVRDIMGMSGGPNMLAWLNQRLPQDKLDKGFKTLDLHFQVVHHKQLVTYYEERSQDLDKVLNIFIRTNSGGTVLSYSDLLLSIAVAQWSSLDARSEIHALVDELNETGDGFNFSKDLVLKAGLMLSDVGNVGFKVENFNHENMTTLENKWPEIKQALLLSAQLLSRFGFNFQTLRADSALLPIAYYLYQRSPGTKYLTHSSFQDDREAIRDWLVRSLLKASGIWGSGLDTLLTLLRETIKKHGTEEFPASKLQTVMARKGKSLDFTDEEINELADMEYGDRRLFAMLTFLFPFIDTKNHFHIDHVFPKSMFTPKRLKKAGVDPEDVPEFRDQVNRLSNLQLLEGSSNIEKQRTLPKAWMKKSIHGTTARVAYCENHLLGEVPDDVTQFDGFYEERREALKSKLKAILL